MRAAAYVSSLDGNGDGVLSFDEYAAAAALRKQSTPERDLAHW